MTRIIMCTQKSNGKTKNEKDMLTRNSNDKSQGNGKQSVPGQKESLWWEGFIKEVDFKLGVKEGVMDREEQSITFGQ